ncbi:MAG: hypothetical protein GMKNLPBB_00524 [Myxococcota bacterium]|nr:hypothetical protein [Myxococcota bacterium]
MASTKTSHVQVLGFGATDTGRVRDHNEDNFYCDTRTGVFAVADGMGGHAGGETASRLAVEAVSQVFTNGRPDKEISDIFRIDNSNGEFSHVRLLMLQAFAQANTNIIRFALENPHLHGMGTTLTAMAFEGYTIHFAHVGDSRAYILRNGELRQLSEDHSLVYQHVKAGLLTEEQARNSMFRNIIIRSVGTEPELTVDSWSFEAQNGDIFLLCSDGLTNMVMDPELREALLNSPFHDLTSELIHRANEHGGDDNISVVVLKVGEGAEIEGVQTPVAAGPDESTRPRIRLNELQEEEVDTLGGTAIKTPGDVKPTEPKPPKAPAKKPARRSKKAAPKAKPARKRKKPKK